jgi:putative redox protein
LRMYINRKMWPVDEITVNLELFKTETGVTIKRWLNFKGELSDIQKNRLLQIADACPIHKILTGSIHIETGFSTPVI